MKLGMSLIPWQPASIAAFAYFCVAAGIYSWTGGFFHIESIDFPKSLENIFWLLVATGIGFDLIAEVILLVKHRGHFRSVSPTEIQKSDLIKIFINFLLTLFFSWVIYFFVINREPDLKDPLAFVAVSAFIYFATAAFCRNLRYIPIFYIVLRRKHERV